MSLNFKPLVSLIVDQYICFRIHLTVVKDDGIYSNIQSNHMLHIDYNVQLTQQNKESETIQQGLKT